MVEGWEGVTAAASSKRKHENRMPLIVITG